MERDQDRHEDAVIDLGSATAETKGNDGNSSDLGNTQPSFGLLTN